MGSPHEQSFSQQDRASRRDLCNNENFCLWASLCWVYDERWNAQRHHACVIMLRVIILWGIMLWFIMLSVFDLSDINLSDINQTVNIPCNSDCRYGVSMLTISMLATNMLTFIVQSVFMLLTLIWLSLWWLFKACIIILFTVIINSVSK